MNTIRDLIRIGYTFRHTRTHIYRCVYPNPLKIGKGSRRKGRVKMESDPFTSFIISPPTRKRIRKISISTRIKAELTTVGVGLWTVSILETARPRALVPRRGRGRLPDAVSTLESLRPLAPVYPTSTGLHAESVPLPILPLALVNRSAEIPYISFVSGISKHPPRLTPRVNWLNGGILVALPFLWEKKVVLCWRRIEIEIGGKYNRIGGARVEENLFFESILYKFDEK